MSTPDSDALPASRTGRSGVGDAVTDLVTAIHATPHKVVLAFAGAGAGAVSWLHSVGGSSRTVLSALDVYAPKSMIELVGFEPSNYTVPRVARAMATGCLRIARRQLDDGSSDPIVGVGSSATIATDRLKRGEHRVAIAVRDTLGIVDYFVVMEKGARDRAGEEDLVSIAILRAIADACGVLGAPDLPLTPNERALVEFSPCEALLSLAAGRSDIAVVQPDGAVTNGADLGPRAILSGSFNPLHAAHLELAATAAELTGLPALFELPLMNAAKSPIELLEARRRAQQFAGRGPVALTRTPLFAQKAELFPGSVFVVGFDTAERIVQRRFYDGDEGAMLEALDRIRRQGCRFLVAGRAAQGEFRTLADLALPPAAADLFTSIGERDFRLDLSSTALRALWPSSTARR
ncbi:MAG: hypothetical protein KF813_05135 [Trueperaceae bacterium]|nr:hypothetical protein [Trueperaceae bacterium]